MLTLKLLNSLMSELCMHAENILEQAMAEQRDLGIVCTEPQYIQEITEHIIKHLMSSHTLESLRLLALQERHSGPALKFDTTDVKAQDIARLCQSGEDIFASIIQSEDLLREHFHPIIKAYLEKALFSEIRTTLKNFEQFHANCSSLKFSDHWEMPDFFPILVEEAKKNQEIAKPTKATQVPLLGYPFPSGAKYVKLLPVGAGTDRNTNVIVQSSTLILEIANASCEELLACSTTRPYFERRFDPITEKHSTMLVWPIGEPLGFKTKFEVPTSIFSGQLYLQNPQTSFSDFLNQDITLIVMGRLSSSVEKFKMMEIAASPSARALLAAKKASAEISDTVDTTAAY